MGIAVKNIGRTTLPLFDMSIRPGETKRLSDELYAKPEMKLELERLESDRAVKLLPFEFSETAGNAETTDSDIEEMKDDDESE